MNKVITENKRPHLLWIDLVRCIAIGCVILVHTTESVYGFYVDYMNTVGISTKLFAFTLFTAGRLGVPLFIFISGYLLLDREYDDQKCKKFWKNNLLNLVVSVEIWIIIYNIFLMWYNAAPLSVEDLWKNMLFIKPTNMTHMWYMPMIIGMYIFIPFVANVLKKIDLKTLKMPCVVCLFCLFIIPVINVLLGATGREQIASQLDLNFSGGIYGFLLILGYAMKKGVFHKIKSIYLVIIGCITFAFTMGLQLFAYSHAYKYNVWYNCVMLIITTICIFEFLSRIQVNYLKRMVQSLAKCSFGVYLIHNVLIMIFTRYIQVRHASVKIFIIYVLGLGISWLIVSLLSRCKRVSKILFFIR